MKRLILASLLLALSSQSALVSANVTSVEDLINQVRMEAKKDQKINKEREAKFLKERAQQKAKLEQGKALLAAVEKKAEDLRKQFDDNEQALVEKRRQLKEEAAELNDIFAIARQNASELQSLVSRSMVTAQFPVLKSIVFQAGYCF